MAEFHQNIDEQQEEEDNIWVAASNGDTDRVKELLALGISVNAQDEYGYSPMYVSYSF
jgi:ankyrin repeat protein